MSQSGKTIKLIARPLRREVFKNGPDEVNLGDRNVFTHALFDNDEEIGFDGGACTVVRMEEDGSYYFLCNVSMSLPDGTLAFQTFIKDQMPPPPFHTAITGGTGAYRGARGEMHIDPASPDTHYYTITLDATDA